ncbi:zinc finger matrin-type protein 1-like isoform X1 [Podarcis raffonei]|uniref:zinc finger matrin-type protein 1-like isoform X1 n=2 Tax=Podarcis raffonei TaxID=65483 RepID=UPI0023291714|nr:zinc finger matrin-type protein 1-like isoform X1 [Podarcis raffonei]
MAAAAAPAAATAVGRERAEGGGGAPSPPLPPPPCGQRADDTLDEVTRKELCTDTFCKVCGAVLQFESQRAAHYEGKRHAQKIRLYLQMHSEQKDGQEPSKQKLQYVNFQMDPNVDKNTYCRLCNMVFTSPIVAQAHYLGKIHTKKLKRLSEDQAQQPVQNAQPEPGPSAVPSLPEPSVENASQDTDVKDPSPSCKATLDLDDPDKFCKLCSAPFNNPLMAHQHYVGKKHKRNEARKKLMSEMGSEAVPAESQANAVGVGKYICPICSISLTSIEMYQSHMQGNKHQIKETMISNLITNSRKTYSSFQDELEDYIKVQKARGLEPKTHFRKPEEEFQMEEYGAMNGHERGFGFDQDQFSGDANTPEQYSGIFSETCPPLYSVRSRLSHWPPGYRDLPKLENAPVSQHSTGSSLEKQASPLATYKSDNCNPSSESIDGYKHLPSDSSSAFHRRSQKSPKTFRKEEECSGEEDGDPRPPLAKFRRKQRCEGDANFGKGGEKRKRKKEDVDSSAESKSKQGKGRGNTEGSSEKESRKHKKEKKKAEAGGPTEEEMLWDESILGF